MYVVYVLFILINKLICHLKPLAAISLIHLFQGEMLEVAVVEIRCLFELNNVNKQRCPNINRKLCLHCKQMQN